MANYHVNYLTGSDVTGDGSTGNPWASISYALTTSSAATGDVIKVVGSTKTTLDTDASPNANGRTNVLNTSVDLSTSLVAGDIVIVSPGLSDGAEFDGWMHFEVEAVDATTLTTRGYFMFPNAQTGLSMTIEKVNDMIYTTTEENGNWTTNAGAVVECGYDATFTSVIGHTYWVRSDQGVGERSGTKFKPEGGGFGGWANGMPLFRNVAFMRWNYAFNADFGMSVYANNVHILNGQAKQGDAASPLFGPAEDGTTDVYIHDCDESFLDKNYMIYCGNSADGAMANGAPIHLYANQNRDRQLQRNGGCIKHVTGYCLKGQQFGMASLFNNSYNLVVDGDVVLIGLDPYYYQEDYYRQISLMTGTGQVTPTSWKIVKNGGNPLWTPYNYIINDKDNSINGFAYVKLPAGSSVATEILCTGSIETNANAQTTFVDDDGTWTSYNGTVLWKQNLVDQETGTSCLEIVLARGSGYTAERNSTYLAAFPAQNAGLKLTGLEIRKKNLAGSTSIPITLKSPIAGTYASEVEMGSFTPGTIGSWNTATITISNNVSRWIDNQVGPDVLIPIYFKTFASSGLSRLLIDSITPIYS
jgi:hypothetical protein